jgi:hypothetical protein
MERTKKERQEEIKPILEKLRELHINIKQDDGIKEFFILMQQYIQEGNRIELNIPCPTLNVTIKGILAVKKNEKVSVKLTASN